jgi:hypothetical protein
MTAVDALTELIEKLEFRMSIIRAREDFGLPHVFTRHQGIESSTVFAKALLVRAKAEEEEGATRIAAKCNEKSGELWRRYKSGPPEDRGNSYLEVGSDALDEFAQSIARTLSPTPEDAA